MRKIVILTEANKATKDALAAHAAGERLSPEQVRLVAKHNAGKQAGKHLAISNKLSREVVDDEENSKGKTTEERTRSELRNHVRELEKDRHTDAAAALITDGMKLKNNEPVDVRYLGHDKVHRYSDSAEALSDIASLSDKDMRRVTRKLGGKRAPGNVWDASYNGKEVNVSPRYALSPDKDGRYITKRKGIYLDSRYEPEERWRSLRTIGAAREKSRNIRSMQQFGKKK